MRELALGALLALIVILACWLAPSSAECYGCGGMCNVERPGSCPYPCRCVIVSPDREGECR